MRKHASNACVNFFVFGVKFLNVPAVYIENAQKGLCKEILSNLACVNDKQYSMSALNNPLFYIMR